MMVEQTNERTNSGLDRICVTTPVVDLDLECRSSSSLPVSVMMQILLSDSIPPRAHARSALARPGGAA